MTMAARRRSCQDALRILRSEGPTDGPSGGAGGGGWYFLAISTVGAAVGLAVIGSDDSDGGEKAAVKKPKPASP
jgi:hypothetical protein